MSADAPLIGVCLALERAQFGAWEADAVLLPRSYPDAVQAAGGIPLGGSHWKPIVARRRELLKKLADSTGEAAQQILAMIHEQDRDTERKSREGMKLGGLITAVVGAGVMLMFRLMNGGAEWAVGLVPFFVGAALLLYVYVLAPRAPR